MNICMKEFGSQKKWQYDVSSYKHLDNFPIIFVWYFLYMYVVYLKNVELYSLSYRMLQIAKQNLHRFYWTFQN